MNKDLHNIDDVFSSAYQEFEYEPSPEVWKKINAGLDKKETESYKRRLIGWKRTAILLLLLLTGFVLYESGIFKQNSNSIAGTTDKNNILQKLNPSIESPGNRNTGSDPGKIEINGSKTPDEQNQKDISALNLTGLPDDKNQPAKNVAVQKNSWESKQADFIIKTQKGKSAFFPLNSVKNTVPVSEEDMQENKTSLNPLTWNKSISRTATTLFNNISNSHLPSVKDPDLKRAVADNKQLKKRNNPGLYWAISGFASYDFMNYRLDNDLSAVKKIKQSEAHEPSFSTGLLLTRQLKKGWSLQTGLIYSNTQIGISPQKLFALQEPAGDVAYKYITSSGYAYIKPAFGSPLVVGDSLTTAQAKHTLQFVSVPVVIKHSFGKKKLTINPGAGVEANFLTSAKIETEIKDAYNQENVSINKLKGARSFYWSVTADAELQYQVNKKIAVSLRPSFRYAISPITKNNVVETFPYSFGLGLTVKCRL
jgi:hypothetical protein